MISRFITTTALALSTLGMAVPAYAQAQVTLDGDVKLVQTVEENGVSSTRLVEPDRVVPGDRLLFVTAYENTTGETVDDFIVNNPLPDAVMLAENGDFEVSVDGGTSFGPLDRLSKLDEAGVRAPATVEDVTHLRWSFDSLAPGAKGALQYYAVIR
ncbi:MAG: hypothetical protein WA948_04750 [Pontixanthobacter sp.]